MVQERDYHEKHLLWFKRLDDPGQSLRIVISKCSEKILSRAKKFVDGVIDSCKGVQSSTSSAYFFKSCIAEKILHQLFDNSSLRNRSLVTISQ